MTANLRLVKPLKVLDREGLFELRVGLLVFVFEVHIGKNDSLEVHSTSAPGLDIDVVHEGAHDVRPRLEEAVHSVVVVHGDHEAGDTTDQNE